MEMMSHPPAQDFHHSGQGMPPGQVLAYRVRETPQDGHERATHAWIAREVADLFDVPYGGFSSAAPVKAPYYVPDDTLDAATARALGIEHVGDLLGGVVPVPFLATKILAHPLVEDGAAAIADWSQALGLALRGCTLPGFSAFSAADALRAYAQLCLEGRVRLKLPTGVGGRGQWLLESEQELVTHLQALPPEYLGTHGIVLERHLERLVTYSVGEVECAGLRIAYHGTQILTCDREGHEVYGGSDLCIVRGTLDTLVASGLPPRVLGVVQAARDFDRTIRDAWPTLLASRRNYDVVHGVDAAGNSHCGVLEQSWRVGGATPAELAALQAFGREPALAHLHACTRELHGQPAPDGVDVYYAGVDPHLGPLVKYRATSRF